MWSQSRAESLAKIILSFLGSGALFGKMLLARIIEINEIDAYFDAGYVK